MMACGTGRRRGSSTPPGRTGTPTFYYQTAQYLLLPADFLSSNNLEKLGQEAVAATPPGLPGQTPMAVQVASATVNVTNLHTDASLGGLDLVISYDAPDVSDPVQSRMKTVALMKAILTLHPELKAGFHGLWVFANAPNQHPFSLELPMAADRRAALIYGKDAQPDTARPARDAQF